MVEPEKYINNTEKVWTLTNGQRLVETLWNIYKDLQIDIGIIFQNN